MKNTSKPPPKPLRPWEMPPPSPNCVTIFGGGIAGLTAAHELVERGYAVQLWEPAADVRYPHRGCDVGGLARTQWSRVHWDERRSLDRFEPLGDDVAVDENTAFVAQRSTKIVSFPQKICFMKRGDSELALRLPDSNASEQAAHVALRGGLKECQSLVVKVAGWAQLSSAARLEFAFRVAEKVLKAAMELADGSVSHSSPVSDVVFEHVKFSVRMDHLGERGIVFVDGGAPAVPGVVARLLFADEHGGALAEWLNVVELWAPGTPIALGAMGAQELPVVLAEVVEGLALNPGIKQLYVEASHRDLAHLVGRELSKEDEDVFSRVGQDRARRIFEVIVGELSRAGLDRFAQISGFGPSSVIPSFGTRRHSANMVVFPDGDALVPPSQRKKNATPPHEVRIEVVALAEFPNDAPAGADISIGFRVRERWLPGEHGYRFFPSFYRHVFDTMQRTPILETVPKTAFSQDQERSMDVSDPEPVRYVESGRTVFDNIRPTEGHVLAFGDGDRPTQLPRERPRSLEEIREYIRVMFGARTDGGFEMSLRDSTRFTLKLFKFMTSCDRRRQSYESISWWDFVDGDSYEPGAQRLIQSWPEALVAMDARVADARTHGSSFIQLVLDNLRPAGYRDGTLMGPTTEAWLKHWRAYLEAQGVKFIHGKLEGFDEVAFGERTLIWPRVSCYEPRYPTDDRGKPLLPPGYFVMAVQANRAQQLAERHREVAERAGLAAPRELSDLHRTTQIRTAGLDQAVPSGDFRHFAGIQYYFAEDVFWVNGHVYYPDSPWSITSISQARFWNDRTDWEHGFRGVVSAIIGTWDKPGTKGKKAWECTPTELAEEVWSQIKEAVETKRQTRVQGTVRFATGSRSRDGSVPDPVYWHFDEGLVQRRKDDPRGPGYDDESPFHIATPEGYALRPGDPNRGYAVENGWVICGMHAKTFTRIPSMEAANESARHAVNAIIKNSTADTTSQAHRFRKTPCDVWNPEDHEIEDFQWFKDLDEKLVDRELPHILDILGSDYVVAHLLRGGPNDPLDPLTLSRKVMRMAMGVLSGMVAR